MVSNTQVALLIVPQCVLYIAAAVDIRFLLRRKAKRFDLKFSDWHSADKTYQEQVTAERKRFLLELERVGALLRRNP